MEGWTCELHVDRSEDPRNRQGRGRVESRIALEKRSLNSNQKML